MSRRIVITCWGSYGDVFPYVGLAKAIKSRGHVPVVATSEGYRLTVEREGIEFAAVGPEVDPTDRDLMARVMHPAKGTEVIVRELLLPHLKPTGPLPRDLLLVDSAPHQLLFPRACAIVH